MLCSSQWLLETHTEQTWLRSEKRNSRAMRRYCLSFSELVVTLMPSCTGVVHAGSSRFTPDTSTMHKRQAPTGDRLSSQQSVGMYFPLARATSRIVWPCCAATYSPSIRMEIFSGMAVPQRNVTLPSRDRQGAVCPHCENGRISGGP